MYHVNAADHVLFTTRCLPVLRARCRVAYRTARDREENTAETIAIAWRMFAKCRERGKYPSHAKLADYAIRHFAYGRRIGQRDNAKDVSGPRARAIGRCNEVQLNEYGMVSDSRVNPADDAAFRIDFVVWLSRLPDKKRAVAKCLAIGEATGNVAKHCHCTPGRISQLRRELEANWQGYQLQYFQG